MSPLLRWSRNSATHRPTGNILGNVFLGDDLLAFLVLAFGGALFVGNVFAIVRPPERQLDDANLEHAPVARSVTFAILGLVAAIWALATLIVG